MSAPNDEIARLLDESVSETELYERLADSSGLGVDEINKAAEGRTLFSRIWRQSKVTVCGHAMVKAYIANQTVSDATTIAAQIANILVNIPGVNVIVVACLIVRIGLRNLCQAPPP